jgi:anti-sigma B factor antagonist
MMNPAQSRVRVEERDGVTCILFVDRNILDEANIQQIGAEISEVIDQRDTPAILISFMEVDHLSSAALGVLITLNKKVADKGGQLRLTNIDQQIMEVFKITKLDQLFSIHDTVEDGLASLN